MKRDIYLDHAHPVQQWQHVVLVKKKDVISLYLDGKRVVEELPHTFGAIDPVSVRMGRTFPFDIQDQSANPNQVTPIRPLLGRLDEVALYDKPLTAEQVARHFNLATGQDSP
ncbi:MAG: LamG-like jellyroll fold domain-containing protein [Planctomycetota bacterium]